MLGPICRWPVSQLHGNSLYIVSAMSSPFDLAILLRILGSIKTMMNKKKGSTLTVGEAQICGNPLEANLDHSVPVSHSL